MLYKFIYRETHGINVWKNGQLLTTISCDDTSVCNKDILSLCQKWLDEKDLLDMEYKVFVEIQ